MEPPQKKQRLDPPPQNLPSHSTFRDAYGNGLFSNFDGPGISNAGGNFHVAGNVNINSQTSPQPPAAEEETEKGLAALRKELLESLRFDQIDARHDSIKRAHAKTCRWFLDTDVYKKWEATGYSDVHNFLWIKGKPGAGKSTLMKFLHGQIHARTRRKNKNEILISFFFNARGHELEKSTFGLYRSLLWQLLDKMPDLQRVLDELRPDCQWADESLKSLIEEAIQDLGDTPIFCLIDALDECDQDQIRDMVVFLEGLVDMQSSLHVCFASRHYPHITVQTSHEIILEERDGHKKDIATYLSSALHITPKVLAEQIRSEMQEKADGVFMWVVLLVDILNREFDSGRKYRLRERLQQLPGDLHQLFRDILTRDTNNRAGLLLCIQWVLFAKEPLTPKQLHMAILSGTEPEFLPHCHYEPYPEEDVQKYILDNSKGLVQSIRSKVPTVQFIHESVKDSLLQGHGLGDLFDDLGSNIRGKSHEALKNCCLTYITMKPLIQLMNSLSENDLQTFPFLEYANSGVLYHGNEAGRHGISQDSFVTAFPRSQWVEQHNLVEKFGKRKYTTQYTPTVSLLYILAEAGVPDLIRAHSNRQSCFEVEAEHYGVPIQAALHSRKREPTVQVMLELQAERIPGFDYADFCGRFQSIENKSLRPRQNWMFERNLMFERSERLIEQLAEYGNDQVLLFFLETTEYSSWSPGVDISALFSFALKHNMWASARLLAEICSLATTARSGETPLHCASEHGAIEAAKVLISRGANLNAKDLIGSTPLHLATTFDRLEVSKLLIDCGADISAAKDNGETPLHLAVCKRYLQTAQLLLEYGASTSILDWLGRTPLHDACSSEELEITRLLIDHGADILAKTQNGLTPLHCGSNEKIIGLLLDLGAENYTMDDSKATPLHDACLLSRTELVRQLLKRGANVAATNTNGDTPLHKACQGCCDGEKIKAVKLLIENKADLSAATDNGETPLHQLLLGETLYADDEIRLEIAKILVNSGADVSCPDKIGRTPLQLALSNVYWHDIAEFLQSCVPGSPSPATHHVIEGPLQLRSPSNQREFVHDDLFELG